MGKRRATHATLAPLFNFSLTPAADIANFNTSHSWYWFAFGAFWVQVGRHQLLRYAPGILRHWRLSPANPWDSHQVTERLGSGVIDQLPAVLRPIPDELHRYVRTLAAHRQWRDACRRWQSRRVPRGRDPDEFAVERGDVSHAAVRWTGERSLDMTLCRFGHDIEVFRHDDTITLRWFGAGVRHRNLRIWTAPDCGQIQLPVAQYLREVRSAHKRLTSALADRPAEFRRAGLPLDTDHCNAGLAEFSGAFETALRQTESYRPDYPWHKVLAACETIERWASTRRRSPSAS